MAFTLGQVTQFDDPLSVLNPAILLAARAVNLPANKGVVYQMMQAPPSALVQQIFEIRSRTKTALSGLVGDGASAGWDDSATTDLPITSAYIGVLTVGTVIKVEDEIVIVSDVDFSAKTVDVYERGAGSTTAASHADTTAFEVIGHAGLDTSLKYVTSKSELTVRYTNYVQTIFETLDYTQFESIIGRQALNPADHIALMRIEAMTRVSEILSVSAIKGVKRAGSASMPYMSSGLLEQLTDTASGTRPILSYNASSAALNEAKLKAALETAFVYGNPDTIIVNQTNKNKINAFNNAIMINTDRTDTSAGIHVDSYNYEGKVLQVVVDADMPTACVPIVTKSQLQKGFLQGDVIRFVDEPKVSSREHRESIQGSLGFLVEGVGFDHILIYGLTAS